MNNFVDLLLDKLYSILNGILKKNISKERWSNFVQFIKFGIVGLTNTIISYVLYVLILNMLSGMGLFSKIDYLIAQFLSFILSVLWSFYWNNKFVFRANTQGKKNIFFSLVKTYISYAFTGLFLNAVFSYIWVEILGISKYFAPLINLIISVPLNFLLNKCWAFKNSVK